MRVSELIELLSEYEDSVIIIMSSDIEGNHYSPLSEVSTAMYVAETTWSGESYSPDEEEDYPTAEKFNEVTGEWEDSPRDDGIPCLVLYPVN